MSWPRRLRRASIRSRGRDWRRRWLAHKSSLMSRTHLRGRTRPCWNSSRLPPAISSRPKPSRASVITSRFQSSALNGCLPADFSARRWPRKTSSKPPRFPTPSSAQRSSLNSPAALPTQAPMGRPFACRPRSCSRLLLPTWRLCWPMLPWPPRFRTRSRWPVQNRFDLMNSSDNT